jgi:hypothetical protein
LKRVAVRQGHEIQMVDRGPKGEWTAMANDEGPILLDIDKFTSPEQALEAIGRERGFDDAVRDTLTKAIDNNAVGFSLPLAFVLGSVSRARALHEAIVREIQHTNPQAAFTLMRQFAETVAVVRYTADHPAYVDAMARHPSDLKPGMPKRKSIQALVGYMDRKYSTQFGLVYADLCEITHYGSTAMWNSHRIVSEEQRQLMWTSTPAWRSQRDQYIACAELLELSEEMEAALAGLAKTYLATTVQNAADQD